jgi:hypothetical protein
MQANSGDQYAFVLIPSAMVTAVAFSAFEIETVHLIAIFFIFLVRLDDFLDADREQASTAPTRMNLSSTLWGPPSP